MIPPETADAINHVASDWAARADRGLSEAEAAELGTWLGGDSRRVGAYMRMTAVLADTEQEVIAPRWARSLVRPTASKGVSRRKLLVAGGAMAASVIGGGVYLGMSRGSAYETRKGEKRVIALEDGSILTLNTATRLEVRFSDRRRLIRLAHGEALFDVAKDPARPFIVRADSADVRAIGTSFSVAGGTGPSMTVLVREGVVELVQPRASALQPMRLAADTRAVIAGPNAPVVVERIEPGEVSRDLAWREGRLVFAGESLSAAAAQFARYSDTRIIVSDPVLAGSGVAGVYDLSDPIGFAQATALSLGARTQVCEGQVLISR
jgi:transmembrane sensor